jgi:hypothetical protein
MDYLDNKLKYKKPQITEDPRQPKKFIYRNLFISLSLGHMSYFLISIFKNRKNEMSKRKLIKTFYSKWFPVYFFGYLMYPVDNWLWSSLSSQVSFSQSIIFNSPQELPNSKS